jgi:hypothetical protein
MTPILQNKSENIGFSKSRKEYFNANYDFEERLNFDLM